MAFPVAHVNNVILHRADLVMRWVTVASILLVLNQSPSLTVPPWEGATCTGDGQRLLVRNGKSCI